MGLLLLEAFLLSFSEVGRVQRIQEQIERSLYTTQQAVTGAVIAPPEEQSARKYRRYRLLRLLRRKDG